MTELELINLMAQRKIVMPDEFYSLDIAQRHFAFTVSKLSTVEQMRTVLNALQKSVKDGGTFNDFKKQVAKDGIKLPESYLDNVFRTNVQNAYSRGRWQEQQSGKERRPYLQYRAINDNRVRPSHLKLNRVIRHIDDEFWLNNYPPISFRCRCACVALSERDAKELGVTPDNQLPVGVADDSWTFKPRLSPEQQIDDYANTQLDMFANDYPQSRPAIQSIKDQIKAEGEAAQQTIRLLALNDATRATLPNMLEQAVKLDKTLQPSAIAMVNEYANGTGKGIDDYVQVAKDTKTGSRVFDWLKSAYASVLSAAKSVKNKLTGNLNAGAYVFSKGQVIGINTPSLFKAATIGQRVEIINAKGLGIDLNKLGSDGVLLPPDLRLEVVDVKDGVVVMQPTTKAATQLFKATGGQLFAL